jgi:unsaturated chondroitin disaccharide hydrolase
VSLQRGKSLQRGESLHRAEALARRIGPRDGLLPHVTGDDGRWELLSPLDAEDAALTGLPWTGGFVAGQLWLAGEHERAAVVTDLLRPRAGQPTTHDLGFLFWPSAVLGLAATGDNCHRVLGLRAAASLARRALPNGVIQMIGALGDPENRGRTIVDTWPNLLLLWWAERQGMAGAADAAAAHLDATLPALLREDGSTFHAARIADDGAVLEQGTINGYAAGSTWARGQAWALHGLATAHRATGGYREEAERAARWFLDHLPDDLVPPWDFDAPSSDRLKPVTAVRRDASAGAIAASALLELGWEEDARRLLDALAASCLNPGDADGVLLHCCYRQPIGRGLVCATVWGDFFLLDALERIEAPARRLDPFR